MKTPRKLTYLFPILMLGLLLGTNVWASDITEKIQKQYETLTGFKADFVQQLRNAASGEVQQRKGRIYFKQPGLVRWETASPERELLIVGPNEVWDYFEDEGIAIKYPVSHILSTKTMIKFVSGKARLEEDFVVEEMGEEMGLTKLMLTPREPEPSLVLAYVWVDPENYLLKSILLLDFYGNGNKLGLDNVTMNPDLTDGLFEFTPPEGTDVQENTQG